MATLTKNVDQLTFGDLRPGMLFLRALDPSETDLIATVFIIGVEHGGSSQWMWLHTLIVRNSNDTCRWYEHTQRCQSSELAWFYVDIVVAYCE